MEQNHSIKIFEDKRVRVQWDEKHEKWYFSIIDIIKVLTDSINPRKYWSVLKTRLKAEDSELATKCSQLKMKSSEFSISKNNLSKTIVSTVNKKPKRKQLFISMKFKHKLKNVY